MTNNKHSKTWKRIALICLTILLVINFRPLTAAETPKHYTDLEFPPLREVELPEYHRYQLDNGMVVYLMPDHKLPLISGRAIVRTGSRWEPGEKAGLADLVGIVMRSGGTEQHTPDQLNEMLERRAATVETSLSTTFGAANFSALSEDLETVFKLFAEVLRFPAFDPEQLELAKTQLEGNIARRNDDPGDIAGREFQKLIYGAESPYARTIEYQSLANISREDLINFYRQYFHPERIILGIVGDFETEEMKELIEAEFGDWERGSNPEKNILPTVSKQQQESGIFFVDQPQLTQSNILLGHLGDKLDNPDYPALSVLNGVLNGFGGRLFNEVRSRQGLAYSVYGVWSPRYDYPGVFIAGGQTRSDATVAFIKAVLGEIKKLQTTPISEEELADAKESILNSFVFNFQKQSQSLGRLMRYEYYGYPADFLYRYQRGVKETTIEDVQRVANEYLQPDDIVTLVVGNKQEIQPPLRDLGWEVTTVDVSIPEPKNS